MPAVSTADDTQALASLMAFWADSGVSVSYEDAPVDRLAEGKKRLEAPVRAPAPAAAHVPQPASPIGQDIGL